MKALSEYTKDLKRSADMFIVNCEGGIDQLESVWMAERFRFKITKVSPTVWRLRIRTTPEFEPAHGRYLETLVWQHRNTDTFVVATIGGRLLAKRLLRPIVGGFYPYLVSPYLPSRTLLRSLEALETSLGGVIRVKRTVARRPIRGNQAQRTTESSVTWTDLALADVTSRVERDGATIRKLDFVLERKRTDGGTRQIMAGHISNDGYLRCQGEYVAFCDAVVDANAGISSDGAGLLRKLVKPIDSDGVAHPFALTFPYSVFNSTEDLRRLRQSLNKAPKSMVTVLHSNPYFHAACVDMLDGSVFDVWVVEPTRLTIVPQVQASAASASRLTGHLMESFTEGTIEGA